VKPLRFRGALRVGIRTVEDTWSVAPGPDQLLIRAPGNAELPAGTDWEARAVVSVLHTSDRGTVPIPVHLTMRASATRAGPNHEVTLNAGGAATAATQDVAAAVRALDVAFAPGRLRACATCQLSGEVVGILGIQCRLRPEIKVVPAFAWCDGYERVGPPASTPGA
jgi:hypothetical protein